jgi:RHS repeat-associated protein
MVLPAFSEAVFGHRGQAPRAVTKGCILRRIVIRRAVAPAKCSLIAAVFLPAWLATLCVLADSSGPNGASTPVNHVVPVHSSPSAAFVLSPNPSETELRSVRLFGEPLIPAGAAPTAAQNAEVAAALRSHAARSVVDDYSALEQFVVQHPDSPWTPSLWYNLGREYYKTGWYTKALEGWGKAWQLLKPATEPAAKAMADRAAGELALMYGRIGRMDELTALLDSVQGRVIIGSAEQKIAGAREGLWMMQHRPEVSFRCGPMALYRINMFTNPPLACSPLIQASKSTTNGFSLSQVAELSRQVGMNYQMAFRSLGAPLIMPAVVNWKVGHYAALIREEGGRYLLQDPTFQNDAWVSREALDAETTGYFLVPPGDLPAGWRAVSAAEGSTIWGKGQISLKDQTATTPKDKKKPCPPTTASGMAVADVSLMLVSLNLQDNPVGYSPPLGPEVRFLATYNQYEAGQPAVFNYSNLGQKWTFNWLAYISDNPSSPSSDVTYYTDGGGTLSYSGFDYTSQSYAPELKSETILTRTSPNSYSMLFQDGSKYIFAQPTATNGTSRNVFLTQIVDPQGNSVQITYDSLFRVLAVTDAIGQVTVLSYTDASDSYKITQVTDPFGRKALFQYNANGLLSQITDCIGLTSQFTYDSGTFIQALTTPYGTTTFAYANTNNSWGPNQWLVTTYPDGTKERVEFTQSPNVGTPAVVPSSTIPTGMATTDDYLNDRNTYYWDRNAYASYVANPNDYTSARLYHWLHSSDGQSAVGVLESEKAPLENRIWFTYPNQPYTIYVGSSSQPNYAGRVLDDGTTQLKSFGYNALGMVTNVVDPVGRSMTYIYASNLVDLLEVHQTTGSNNDLLAKFAYNAQHLATNIVDAAGQVSTMTYNSRGQLLTSTDAKGETTTFTYDANGYLTAMVGPLGGTNDTITLSHDAVGRLRSFTNTDGYTLAYSYDNLDRLTNITYPDGTFESFTYSNLDPVQAQDRLGRKTLFTYDFFRQLLSYQDPLGRTTRFEYCGCGGVSALTDPLGQQTTWEHDVQGRLTAKQYPNGARLTYTYENTTSRLKSMTDEKGQYRVYGYYPDDNLESVSYPNAQVLTPAVSIAYDPNYVRRVSMQDGIGTTTWNYYPAGVLGALQVSTVTGPWSNETVTCQYDGLGRITNQVINGATQTCAYDVLGRVTNDVNTLGSFAYSYDGATMRVLGAVLPNGQTTHYTYLGNAGDRRLQQITHQKANSSLISSFTYAYNPVGQVTNWVQQMTALTQKWNLAYDAADQLLAVTPGSGATNTVSYAYSYDVAANGLSATNNTLQSSRQFNSLNEPMSASDSSLTNATFEWDANNRLTAINQGTNRSEFSYDAAGRRVWIVEKQNGVVVRDRRFTWCGMSLGEERDASNNLVTQYFNGGVRQNGTNLYYAADHLGSIRELTDPTGAVAAEISYDPYGLATKVLGSLTVDFGFASQFQHAVSGLGLFPYRAYNARLGRWLSRDPLAEQAGVNLYAYADNDPVNGMDPFGLWKNLGDVLVEHYYEKAQDPFAVHPPIEVTEEEFQQEVANMQELLSQQNESQMGFGQIARQFDSKWHSERMISRGLSLDQLFCWRGHLMYGHELNYYFEGMLFKESGKPLSELASIMTVWKFQYLTVPSGNAYGAALAGFMASPDSIPESQQQKQWDAFRAAHPSSNH